jgi:hypothetical protein
VRDVDECFAEFFFAYQECVEWIERLVEILPHSDFRAFPEYLPWQEKHQIFNRQLRELIALEDFADLRSKIDHPEIEKVRKEMEGLL